TALHRSRPADAVLQALSRREAAEPRGQAARSPRPRPRTPHAAKVRSLQMKIGLVLDHFDPRRGGVEQWTYQLSRRLLQGGHEVHVIAAGFGPQIAELPLICHALPEVHSRIQ